MTRASIFLLSTMFLWPACSDDSAGSKDQGADRAVWLDAGVDGGEPDAATDARLDSSSDVGPVPTPEVGPPEAGLDAAAEDGGGAADLAATDALASDAAAPALYGTVTRSVEPVLDGKGPLYIGVVNPLFGTPLVIHTADLSKPGSSVDYQFNYLEPGDYEVWAFMDDNHNANPLLLGPDQGDLALAGVIPLTLQSGSTRLDIELNQVAAVPPDAGVGDGGAVTVGAIRGTVSRAVVPALDGVGPLFVSLHTVAPPDGRTAQVSINAVDLSSPLAVVPYYLGNVPPGNYYLRLFLDDNQSVGLFVQDPDKNDLIHTDAIQVHIVAGTTTFQDVTLDGVVP